MKILVPFLVAAAIAGAQPSMAADDATPSAVQSTAEPEAFDAQMSKMKQQMDLMQEQMRKIESTKDKDERDKLLVEHWDAMHQGMQMMNRMWRSHMMWRTGPGTTTDQMASHQQMMHQYMGMQQTMMQHMMGHQGWMMGPHGHMMSQHHMMDMWQ